MRGWRLRGFARALFGAVAPRERFWVFCSHRGGRKNAREYWPDRVVLGGNARVAAHLGSGAPAAADLGSGARARGIAAPGEEAGAVGGVRSGRGAKGDRGREDRPVLGSREETSWAYHGVLSHDEHRLVHEHLRGHKRGDGDVADHSPASLGIHLAQDRGVHGHNRFRASHDGANAFSRRARSTETARWSRQSHDADVATTMGRDDENGSSRTLRTDVSPSFVAKSHSHSVYT